jgi:hypothetical protein
LNDNVKIYFSSSPIIIRLALGLISALRVKLWQEANAGQTVIFGKETVFEAQDIYFKISARKLPLADDDPTFRISLHPIIFFALATQ